MFLTKLVKSPGKKITYMDGFIPSIKDTFDDNKNL